jgi:uncharacterized protein (DUF1684 family)
MELCYKKGVRSSLTAAAILLCMAAAPVPDDAFLREEEAWRSQRRARLESETGWLSLVGLHWLAKGENRFGTGAGNDVALPEGTAPAKAGSFFLEDGRVRVHADPGAGLTLDGAPVVDRVLKTDADGAPDALRLGRLHLVVIRRGDRHAIRVRDPMSPARTGFRGLEYFPADPGYRIVAAFTPYDPPKDVPIPTVLGTVETMKAPGRVTFVLDGKEVSLDPVLEDPDAKELFFLFKDATSGKETYGAGRYLYTALPENGKVVLDFNRAYNPPCAFTPYATCPFPPKQNVLPVRVAAGEKAYENH